MNRWGRIAAPEHSAGAYLFIEKETGEGWKKPPPADAIRVWHRRPGVEDDHDDNWTVWLQADGLAEWVAAYEFDAWLPEGSEPDWQATE